jgi:DNA-directed RNA polymerase specialized sigma24 family protein
MANIFQGAKITSWSSFFPARLEKTADYREVYASNRHRVYSLAFWMTDNELAAEELMSEVFLRAFRMTASPTGETVDRALILNCVT